MNLYWILFVFIQWFIGAAPSQTEEEIKKLAESNYKMKWRDSLKDEEVLLDLKK